MQPRAKLRVEPTGTVQWSGRVMPENRSNILLEDLPELKELSHQELIFHRTMKWLALGMGVLMVFVALWGYTELQNYHKLEREGYSASEAHKLAHAIEDYAESTGEMPKTWSELSTISGLKPESLSTDDYEAFSWQGEVINGRFVGEIFVKSARPDELASIRYIYSETGAMQSERIDAPPLWYEIWK